MVREHKAQNPDNWTAEISVTIEGNFGSYKQKLLKYLKLIAIAYASFDFRSSPRTRRTRSFTRTRGALTCGPAGSDIT